MRSTAHPNISPDIRNTLIGQLFLPCDMYDSYKDFLSDDDPSPEHVTTKPINITATRCCKTD